MTQELNSKNLTTLFPSDFFLLLSSVPFCLSFFNSFYFISFSCTAFLVPLSLVIAVNVISEYPNFKIFTFYGTFPKEADLRMIVKFSCFSSLHRKSSVKDSSVVIAHLKERKTLFTSHYVNQRIWMVHVSQTWFQHWHDMY